jgi:hypothetical protein
VNICRLKAWTKNHDAVSRLVEDRREKVKGIRRALDEAKRLSASFVRNAKVELAETRMLDKSAEVEARRARNAEIRKHHQELHRRKREEWVRHRGERGDWRRFRTPVSIAHDTKYPHDDSSSARSAQQTSMPRRLQRKRGRPLWRSSCSRSWRRRSRL